MKKWFVHECTPEELPTELNDLEQYGYTIFSVVSAGPGRICIISWMVKKSP